jgi:hypothetical protein
MGMVMEEAKMKTLMENSPGVALRGWLAAKGLFASVLITAFAVGFVAEAPETGVDP